MEESEKKNSKIKERERITKINKKLLTNQQTKKKDRRAVGIAGNFIKKLAIRRGLCHPESLNNKKPLYDLRRR